MRSYNWFYDIIIYIIGYVRIVTEILWPVSCHPPGWEQRRPGPMRGTLTYRPWHIGARGWLRNTRQRALGAVLSNLETCVGREGGDSRHLSIDTDTHREWLLGRVTEQDRRQGDGTVPPPRSRLGLCPAYTRGMHLVIVRTWSSSHRGGF